MRCRLFCLLLTISFLSCQKDIGFKNETPDTNSEHKISTRHADCGESFGLSDYYSIASSSTNPDGNFDYCDDQESWIVDSGTSALESYYNCLYSDEVGVPEPGSANEVSISFDYLSTLTKTIELYRGCTEPVAGGTDYFLFPYPDLVSSHPDYFVVFDSNFGFTEFDHLQSHAYDKIHAWLDNLGFSYESYEVEFFFEPVDCAPLCACDISTDIETGVSTLECGNLRSLHVRITAYTFAV